MADALISRLHSENFDDGKIKAVTQSVELGLSLSSAQAVAVLGNFPFSSSKIQALEIIADRITDLQAGQGPLVGAFDFAGDKQRAGDIIVAAFKRRPSPVSAAPAWTPRAAGGGAPGLAKALSDRLESEDFDDGKLNAVRSVMSLG